MDDPVKTFCGTAAILGAPNVGKSTLLNRIVGKRVSIVSEKPQTTRAQVSGVLTRENRQIVFVDTPGIGKPLGRLSTHLNRLAESSRFDADILLWVIDAGRGPRDHDKAILEKLVPLNRPLFAVLNKIDTTSNLTVVQWLAPLSAAYKFTEVFPVSALTGDNVDHLVETLLVALPPGPFSFEPSEITDQDDETVAAEYVREQIFLNADREVPYQIGVQVDTFKTREDGALEVEAVILVEKASHKKILIGKEGAFIKHLRVNAQRRLRDYFGKKVVLSLWIKLRKRLEKADADASHSS